jgi:hypothetical protein
MLNVLSLKMPGHSKEVRATALPYCHRHHQDSRLSVALERGEGRQQKSLELGHPRMLAIELSQ